MQRYVVIGNISGFLLLLGAWWASANTPRLSVEGAWIWVGVGSLIASNAANGAYLLVGRRAIGRRRAWLNGVHARLTTALDVAALEAPLVDTAMGSDESLLVVVGVEGARFYHRPGCPALRGKCATPRTRQGHEAAGRRPCGICTP